MFLGSSTQPCVARGTRLPWGRALLGLLTLVLMASHAQASQGPPEQLIRDQLPIPTESLWFSAWPVDKMPVFGGRIAPVLAFDKAPWEGRRAARGNPIEARRGALFSFPQDVRLDVASTGPTLMPSASAVAPSGMTIAFWYRVNRLDFGSVVFSRGGPNAAPPDGPGGQKVVATASTPHRLALGDSVDILGAKRWNGRWRITDVTANAFVLEGAVWDDAGLGSAAVFVPRVGKRWDPLLSLGQRNAVDPWRMALVLDNGVPTVSLRHADRELFGYEQVAPQTNYSPLVDDYRWHHIVVRVTREHCAGPCPSRVSVPYPAQPARFSLYIDGEWRAEDLALVPLDLNRLVVGELDVPGETYAQGNFVANPNRLQANMLLSGLHVFDAPLSDSEIVEVFRAGEAGYEQLFPTGPVAATAPGATPPPTIAVNLGPGLPESDLRGVGSATQVWSFRLQEVNRANGSTSFAWVRVDATSSSNVLLQFNASSPQGPIVALTDAGFAITCGGETLRVPAPRPALNRFQLLSLTVKGNEAFFRQDGQLVTKLGACAVPKTPAGGLFFGAGPQRWLAWAGHYDRALSPQELDALVAPGPRLWNSTRDGETSLRDQTGASGMKVERDGSRALRGGWFTNDTRPAGTPTPRPARAAIPFGIEAPATGALAPDDGRAPLTVSFQVRLPKGFGLDEYILSPSRVELAERRWVGTAGQPLAFDFKAYAVCSLFSATEPVGCYLEIIAGVGKGRPGRRYRVNLELPHGPGGPGENTNPAASHVAIAWGPERVIPPRPDAPQGASVTRLEPTVAINGKLINQKHQGEPNVIVDLGPVPGTSIDTATTPGAWTFGPGLHGATRRMSVPTTDIVSTPYDVELLDVRVYSHARKDLESIAGGGRAQSCLDAGRESVSAATGLGDFCGDCRTTHFALGGTTVAARECRDDAQFTEECVATSECAQGAACYKGRCLTTVQSCTGVGCSSCDNECAELGRGCVAEGSSWRCGGCKPGLARNRNNNAGEGDWELACSWQPSKAGGEVCATNGECTTGWCVGARSGTLDAKVTSNRQTQQSTMNCPGRGTCASGNVTRDLEYFSPSLAGVPWTEPARCAYEPATAGAICRTQLAKTESTTVTTPDGQTRQAARCLSGFDGQCEGFAEKRWQVLNPMACKAALAAANQTHGGSCYRKLKVGDVYCTKFDDSSVQDPDRRQAMFHTDAATFTPKVLKRAFLGDNTDWDPARDYSRLIDAGVGPRLIEFAAADTATKTRMQQTIGGWLPLATCASDQRPAQYASYPWAYDINDNIAYNPAHKAGNKLACEPRLQADGGSCPPAGAAGSGRQAWEFCASTFCDERGSKTCKPGGRSRNELAAQGGNQSKTGKSAVKFGVVRVDDTAVDIEKNAEDSDDQKPRYTATVSQRYVPCVLGTRFPLVDLFSLSIDIDRKEPACASEKFTTRILGYKVNAPKMEGAASCSLVSNSVSADAEVCFQGPSCTATADNLDQALSWTNLVPGFKVCIPADAIGVKLPEKKRTFFEAVVPITVSIGMTLDPCLNASVGFAANGMPQVEIKPNIAIGVEAKAGVGVASEEGNIEASAGAKIALTLVSVALPIRWLFELEDVDNAAGQHVLGLFDLKLKQKISIEIDLLSGWMGLYAELSFGPFGLDWEYPLFKWTGIFLSRDLSEVDVAKWRLDFQAAFADALARGQTSPRPSCDGNDCLK